MSQVSGNIQVQEQVEASSFIKEPSMYLVRILNDNYTEFDFVVAVLMGVFGHSGMSAAGIAAETHERGSAIVGRLHERDCGDKVRCGHTSRAQ